jgi:phosphopantothenoylcysteine decarboxylase/phosphopantothenate--cysteine ligase
MSEPDEIYEKILEILLGKKGTVPKKQDLKNISILITAGGTREPIDPVRFIGNSSSGKMGYALASAAKNRGAEVTLISGPTLIAPPEEIKLINITTAEEMREKINEEKKGKKVIIMCAAVSDYKPAITLWQKLKRENETYELKLIKTEDILADIGKNKNGTFLVGFAAESQDLINNALNKLKTKNLDLIVANDVSAMEKDESEVIIIDRSGKIEELPCLLKTEVAEKILDAILRLQMPKL